MQNWSNYKEEVKRFFWENFGVSPSFWDDFNVILRGKVIWVNKGWDKIPYKKTVSLGIPVLRIINKQILKPTSWGLSWLDRNLKCNIIDLSIEKLRILLESGKIPLKKNGNLREGYVAISFENKIIGCGLFKKDILHSQIPIAKRTQLLQILKEQFYEKDMGWKIQAET